ncbi:MAG: alkane 1-monooxygenase [Saprospiraceae bacterium]|nr:alkane 1-monooxygenase [Saprospiraceae bacterium]
MQTRDLKYLLAYLVPLSAAFSLIEKGLFSWTTVALVFGLIPFLELVSPRSTYNFPPEVEQSRAHAAFFDWMLYLNAPILFLLVGGYLWVVTRADVSLMEWIGLTLSTGIVVGANGINVAHELGHRSHSGEQHLAKLMLLPALYQHFFVEHNFGHHKNVATDLDPASAKKGEVVFAFWFKSVIGGWLSAWKLEKERLQKKGQRVWGLQNQMIRFTVFQLSWLFSIWVLFDWNGLVGAIAIATIGFLLLETVNYLEHYGLRRKKLASGHFEPVSPAHSWNSDHEIGRILLYELTRHSDHHYKSTRKYQVLRHMDESPQLPFGYPTSVLLCLMPPLWFAIMDKRLNQSN